MAIYSGHDGEIKFLHPGVASTPSVAAIANLRNFTIESTQDAVEVTTMSGTGFRDYLPGLSTFTVTADIYYDDGDAAQTDLLEAVSDDMITDASAASHYNADFEVYPTGDESGNQKLSGKGVVTSFSITSAVDGMVEASVTIQGSGALTVGTV